MDPKTLDFYQNRSAEWAGALPHDYSPELDGFLDQLPPGAAVLELGCGDGRDAARMIERGFDVDLSDGSPEMARMASERIGREVPVMRYEELDAADKYDAVWCHASLLHVGWDDLPPILTAIHRALKPGGLHFANFKGGEKDAGEGHRDDFGRYYSYIPADILKEAYRGVADWAEFTMETTQGGSFGGGVTIWHALTARK